MEIEKYYSNKNLKELVEIIESIDTYKPEVINYCKRRLKDLNPSETVIKLLAIGVLKKRFYNYFSKGKYITNSPINIESTFLNSNEAKNCFYESQKEYIGYVKDATTNLPMG